MLAEERVNITICLLVALAHDVFLILISFYPQHKKILSLASLFLHKVLLKDAGAQAFNYI
jgi:hypothetical protein